MRGVPPSPGSLREKHPALEPKPGRKKLRRTVLRAQAVCLWRCLLALRSATRRKRTQKQKTPGAGEREAAEPSEERDAHRPKKEETSTRGRASLEIISIKTRLCSRTYCCRKFQESEIITEDVGFMRLFRETLVPTPKPTKAQQDTQKRQSFPDETHVLLKGRCVCEARFTPGREARKNGPSPKDTAGVRRNQRESEEKKNRDAHQHFQEVSSEEAS